MPPTGNVDVSVFQLSAKIVDEFSIYVNKAVVFLDDFSAEVIHWHGAAAMLFNCGALDVREFSTFESADAIHQKAVFFVSAPLSDVAVTDKLQAIITSSNFTEVIVFTTICSPMHSIIEYGPVGVTDDDSRAFSLYRNQILDWMLAANQTNDKCNAELHHVPFVLAPILPSMFVLPSAADVFPLLPTDIDFIRQSQPKIDRVVGVGQTEVDFASLPKQLQLKLKLLACNLNSVLEIFCCSEDIFALGVTSNIVASELSGLSWSKNRKKSSNHAQSFPAVTWVAVFETMVLVSRLFEDKIEGLGLTFMGVGLALQNAQRKASILIVDRTLDIASVVGHFQETLLDKIVSILPHLPGHSTDVAVDMSPVSSIVSNPDGQLLAPGCLGHPDDPLASSLLGAFAVLKHKEALTEINRHLTEVAAKEFREAGSGSVTRPGASVDQTRSLLQQFRGKETSIRRHCGLMQLAMAAVQSVCHPSNAKLDSLLAEEKGLLQSIDDEDSLNVVDQVVKIVHQQLKLAPSQRTHSVTDVLLLLTFIFSLFDSDNPNTLNNSIELESALVKFLLESQDNCDQLISDLLGGNWSQENCLKAVRDILKKLGSLYRVRDSLKHYRDVHEPGSLSSQARLKPLLKQIVQDIVDPSRPDLVDISHKSSGLGDLLKSGFGFFRSASKPRPGDHPLLIIFVIGGATTTEVRQIRDVVVGAKSNVQVVLGSTALVTPTDVLQRLIVQDNLHPS